MEDLNTLIREAIPPEAEVRAVEMVTVLPTFTVGPLTLTDIRDREEQIRYKRFLYEETKRFYPAELRCNHSGLVAHDAHNVKDVFGEDDAKRFLKEEVPRRHSQAFTEGDIHPIVYGITETKTGKPVGAFQWAGIKFVSVDHEARSFKVSAMPVSAFAWLDTPEAKHEVTIGIIKRFLDFPGLEVDGWKWSVGEVHAPLFADPTRGAEWDRTVLTWEVALAAHTDLKVVEIADPAKPNRKYQVIRRA